MIAGLPAAHDSLLLAQLAAPEIESGWPAALLRLHLMADALTVLAYLAIPVVLLALWRRRRRDLPFHWMFGVFAVCILAAGGVHVIEVWNLWHADHWFEGAVKLGTAVASIVTAVLLWRLLPVLARLPSPRELEDVNRELTETNVRLRSWEGAFRAFMDNAPLRCWIGDGEGTYHYGNKRNEEFFQLEGGLAGRRLQDLFPPEMAARFLTEDRAILRTGQAQRAPSTVRIRSREFQIYKFPVPGVDGRLMVGGLALDVTEQQWAHAHLMEQSQLLASVTEALRIYLDDADWKRAHSVLLRCALRQTQSEFGLIGVVVPGGRLRVLAHEGVRWEDHLGRDAAEAARRSDQEHGYLEFAPAEALFGRVIITRDVVIMNPPADGRSAAAAEPVRSFLGVPVRRGSDVVGLVAVANRPGGYDSSAQTQVEMLVQQAGVLSDNYRRSLRESMLEEQVRVSQKMEAVGMLAGGVAHDFNNLLQVINGYTAMALESATPWPERKASLEQVRVAGDRAAQLTQQLLAFGRQQTLQRADLELNRAIQDLLKMIRRVISESITVDFIPGHDLGNIHADRAQIDQVLLNLCLNARDALPNGGRITIETENVLVNGAFRESHPWAKPGRYVLVTVTDNGIGMDRETVNRIFEPFFTTKAKDKGTGLGLSVVYGVVKQHDGMVHVYSEPGKGTTFKIYFPIVGRTATSVGPKHAPARAHGTETILLAEDDTLVRDLAQRILSRAGYRVLLAVDGEEACALFAAHEAEIALVVLDVVMPRLGGKDTYERLAARRCALPVIFCSGYAGAALEGDTLNAPGVRVLAKPYGADEILQAVRTALDAAKER